MSFFTGRKHFDPSTDIPSLIGKTILVTGGNNGVGKESVRRFAAYGAHVYLGARSAERAKAAIADIRATNPHADITFLHLDLADFASVKKATETFLAVETRLDVLMNNAGIMTGPQGLTKDGYEVQFGTNHMGHALLTHLLLPILQRTATQPGSDVRIVNLTSSAQEVLAPKAGLLLDQAKTDMRQVGSLACYGHSKLANVYFTKALAKRFPDILCVAVHPGGVKTGLNENLKSRYPRWTPLLLLARMVFATPEEGAKTQIWASVAPREDVGTGKVYYPVAKEHKGRPLMNDTNMVETLWAWTEKELKDHGF